ncbi:hypothetical protein, partial [Serratia marcescens]
VSIPGLVDSNTLFNVCWRGAVDAYKGKVGTCEKQLRVLERKAQTVSGAARSKQTLMSNAYRAGCNVAESSKNIGL